MRPLRLLAALATSRKASLAVSFLALPAALALAAPPACRGRLAGSVTGTFSCEVRVFTDEEKRTFFVIAPRDQLPDVPTYQPGSFELPGPPAATTYTLDTIGPGMASVAKEGGMLFTATKTTGQRGEVTLTLRSVKAHPEVKGAWVVRGSWRARLLPAGAGKQGEVTVEVDF